MAGVEVGNPSKSLSVPLNSRSRGCIAPSTRMQTARKKVMHRSFHCGPEGGEVKTLVKIFICQGFQPGSGNSILPMASRGQCLGFLPQPGVEEPGSRENALGEVCSYLCTWSLPSIVYTGRNDDPAVVLSPFIPSRQVLDPYVVIMPLKGRPRGICKMI